MTDEKEKQEVPTIGNHEVGVQDELGQEIEARGIENLENDVNIITKNLEQLHKEHTNYEDQWVIDKEVYELMSKPGALRKVEPAINVELEDRYWELKELQFGYKKREEFHKAEAYLANKERQIEIAEENLKGAVERLESFKKEE
jgi:hypothetical protein